MSEYYNVKRTKPKNVFSFNQAIAFAENKLKDQWLSKPVLIVGKKDNGELLYHYIGSYPVICLAGQTGSGKSNMIHSFICSLLRRFNYKNLNLFLVDCKQVEFNYFYKNIPHLFATVEHCAENDINIFDKLLAEIEKRKQQKIKKPYIFVAIDEFSDLAIQFPMQLEKIVEKIADLGSKIGVGLVMNTSRPSRDVITEKIDQAIKTRIGFETASDIDSQMIIKQKGCTELFGNGDGLYLIHTDSKPIHFQSPLITEEEIKETISKI